MIIHMAQYHTNRAHNLFQLFRYNSTGELKWERHLNHVSNKISKVIGTISKLTQCVPRNVLLTLYNNQDNYTHCKNSNLLTKYYTIVCLPHSSNVITVTLNCDIHQHNTRQRNDVSSQHTTRIRQKMHPQPNLCFT